MSEPARPSQRNGPSRVWLVALGLVLGVLLVEVALQTGALALRHGGRAADTAKTSRRRIVAVGDSNTYGLFVKREQAYPKVFEARWNTRAGAPPVEVLNLGFPGTNSSAARNILRRALAIVHPDVVMVMVGANDFWTEPALLEAVGWRDALASWLWRYSRVYRLLFMMRRTWDTRAVAVTDQWSGLRGGSGVAHVGGEAIEVRYRARTPSEVEADGVWAYLAPNLRGMIADARAAGAEIVLLTFPVEADALGYGTASRIIREVAAGEGVPLVDVAAVFTRVCGVRPPLTCPEVLPDHHPSAAGHERIADLLVEALLPAAPAR
jgi:lysophospholipase L1-like esterase